MTKKFQRKIEDFICYKCGELVIGDGYTDHCSNCLWGKHVDVNPGDRSSSCGGDMKPIDYETSHRKIRIKYHCQKCTHNFWVKMNPKDNMESLLKIKKY